MKRKQFRYSAHKIDILSYWPLFDDDALKESFICLRIKKNVKIFTVFFFLPFHDKNGLLTYEWIHWVCIIRTSNWTIIMIDTFFSHSPHSCVIYMQSIQYSKPIYSVRRFQTQFSFYFLSRSFVSKNLYVVNIVTRIQLSKSIDVNQSWRVSKIFIRACWTRE